MISAPFDNILRCFVDACKRVVCGRIAKPNKRDKNYADYANKAYYGWQDEEAQRRSLRAKGKKMKLNMLAAPSPDFEDRKDMIQFIIIHITACKTFQ